MPLYAEAPPTEVPDRIDWVSDVWLGSETSDDERTGFGNVATVGRDGDGGKALSDELSGRGRDAGKYIVFRTSLLPLTVPDFLEGTAMCVSALATFDRAACFASWSSSAIGSFWMLSLKR